MTDLRLTRTTVEVLIKTANPQMRVSRSSVETLIQTDFPQLRLSRVTMEALMQGHVNVENRILPGTRVYFDDVSGNRMYKGSDLIQP